ncbi:hypothetical protein Mlute_02289 [Meiothermus luteus]|uniref:DinB-like domain-containing protein n=2 Tax=Meiothermus luteus TaxID=2026184 RepID=A0A399EHZ7_9DEIN|nr:hypothetical protein Mlute_02289 [Meiothermus luteus]
MPVADLVLRLAKPFLIEKPAWELSLDQHKEALVRSVEPVEQRIQKARSSQAEEIVRHIIGIERWGQRRLQVALGKPLVMDEHHEYKPPAGLDKAHLLYEFRKTRIQTIELAERLKGTIEPTYVPHNALGPLSTRGWLYYLNLHAQWESRRLR